MKFPVTVNGVNSNNFLPIIFSGCVFLLDRNTTIL